MQPFEEATLTGYAVPASVLVMRNDRLGDLVLALPLLRALRQAYPVAKLGILVSSYAAPLLQADLGLDRVHVESAKTLAELKAEAYERALVLWPSRSNAWLAWRAGIPQRLGPDGRWYSALFNRRLKLRRSSGQRSEAEYNLDYLRAMGVPAVMQEARLALGKKDWLQAKNWLKKRGPQGRGPLVIVHPGSGGSAQNWPPQRYAALADRLAKKYKARLLLTGSVSEIKLLEQVKDALKFPAVILRQAMPLRSFAALCGSADLFVSASTGPMHLAAACGAATLSVFPPLRAMSPLRWGPVGNRHAVLSPSGLGFGLDKCDGENFTRRISVERALAAADFLLRKF